MAPAIAGRGDPGERDAALVREHAPQHDGELAREEEADEHGRLQAGQEEDEHVGGAAPEVKNDLDDMGHLASPGGPRHQAARRAAILATMIVAGRHSLSPVPVMRRKGGGGRA